MIISMPSSILSVDAALVLASFLQAAEAVGLGCCPISVIRDHSATVSELLALPQRVIPVSGLCLGWPADTPPITPRLGLDLTVHVDRYAEEGDFAAAHRRVGPPPRGADCRIAASATWSASGR